MLLARDQEFTAIWTRENCVSNTIVVYAFSRVYQTLTIFSNDIAMSWYFFKSRVIAGSRKPKCMAKILTFLIICKYLIDNWRVCNWEREAVLHRKKKINPVLHPNMLSCSDILDEILLYVICSSMEAKTERRA